MSYTETTNPNEEIEIVITPFLENSLGCFTNTKTGDVSHLYNIKMRTPKRKELFVTNEEDLRDVLKHYVLYRQLCQKIEDEMRKMKEDIDASNAQKSKRTERDSRQQQGSSYLGTSSTVYGSSAQPTVFCDKDCHRATTDSETQTPAKKKRCVIL